MIQEGRETVKYVVVQDRIILFPMYLGSNFNDAPMIHKHTV